MALVLSVTNTDGIHFISPTLSEITYIHLNENNHSEDKSRLNLHAVKNCNIIRDHVLEIGGEEIEYFSEAFREYTTQLRQQQTEWLDKRIKFPSSFGQETFGKVVAVLPVVYLTGVTWRLLVSVELRPAVSADFEETGPWIVIPPKIAVIVSDTQSTDTPLTSFAKKILMFSPTARGKYA